MKKQPCTSPYTWEQLKGVVAFLYSEKHSLRGVARIFGKSINHADIQRILQGKEPQDQQKRLRLNLFVPSQVVVINGTIPDGSQALGAIQCKCGRWFIPNSGKRRQCFICQEFRKRK